MRYRILPRALADIDEIADYIMQDNPPAALRITQQFLETFELIADHSGVGVALPEIHVDARMLPVERYIVFYRVENDIPVIVRVLHSARNWQEFLPAHFDV